MNHCRYFDSILEAGFVLSLLTATIILKDGLDFDLSLKTISLKYAKRTFIFIVQLIGRVIT